MPPSKIRMGLQRAVKGVGRGTSKSGVGTGKAIHTIHSCSLTQVLQFFERHHQSSCFIHTTYWFNKTKQRTPETLGGHLSGGDMNVTFLRPKLAQCIVLP